ncbi:MAG: hypothetical protein IKC68_04605 [Bacteroidales bacterium]|nr:hypothetical protein [Bacteroidales bacterium]
MFNALALISVLVVIVMLKTIVSIIPSAMACVIWWKENINVESSVKLSRNRNLSAAVLYLPFCLTAFRFRLYNPEFMDRMSDNARLWTMIGIFTLYCLIRYAATRLVRPQSIPVKTYVAADRSSYTFFILLTLLLLASGSIASFAGMAPENVRVLLMWLSCLVYGVYILRKMQIFASSGSIFTAFLYLCALEILPTGILVVSGMIF